jgi:hypothetical protein
MALDKDFMFDELADEGFLDEVFVVSGESANKTIYAKYRSPDEVIFEGVAQSTDHTLRYRIRDAVLRRDNQLEINGKTYRVSRHPTVVGDGSTYYLASLEVYKP